MQLTINVYDSVTEKVLSHVIKKIEHLFLKEGITVEIVKTMPDNDSWDSLNIEEIAVDTGIVDFAENHDQYLYGIRKQ